MSRYLADRMSGPLAPFAHGLWTELLERGCSAHTVLVFGMRLLTELNS